MINPARFDLVLIVLGCLSFLRLNQATFFDTPGVYCGVQPIGPEELAEKEIDALPGEWPWHAAIYQIRSEGAVYVCGGTMIDERFVVTAAQCVCDRASGATLNNETILVRMGVLNLGAPFQLMSQQYSVADVFIHPNFTVDDFRADIAVLKLSMVVRFSDYIHPVCVDQKGDLHVARGTIVGWGSTNVISDLSDVQLPLYSGVICGTAQEESTFCAGYANFTSVCYGDIGGGIFTKIAHAWHLLGILSMDKNKSVDNENCRIDGFATFTKVYNFLPWIEKVTKLELLETSDEHKFVIPTGVSAKKCALTDPQHSTSNSSHLPQDCGRYVINRILHGQRTELFEFPWMAIVRYFVAPIHELENLCTGSLISNRYVLTAAHCVRASKKPYQVRLGEHTIGQERDCHRNDDQECAPPVRDYDIECIAQHRGYNRRLQQDNIALIRLDQDVTFEENPSCTTPNGIPGQCISAYLCREIMMFIVEKPIPVHRQQYLKQSACKRPDVKFPVCCQLKEIISAESLLPTECGVATSDRIAYGLAAAIFEFPWMALLRYREFNGDIVDGCGGSLINERYVLTAAHCLKVKTKTLDHVRLGELNKNTIIDCEVNDDECAGPVQDIKVERSIIHPQYNMPKFSNDIGLIRLHQSVVFQEHIKPICLPVTHKLQKTLYPRYILTGWGKTEKDELSDILQKAVLPRIDNEQCMQVLKQNQLRIALTDKQMCAGGEKRVDSCRGDSGGPLAWVDKLNDAPRFIQFGIVSLGSNTCGEKSVPSIYTRVGQYMDWILNNLHPS